MPLGLREHTNWIAGERRPAVRGGHFELPRPGPEGPPVGIWPRSTRDDLELAVGALSRRPAVPSEPGGLGGVLERAAAALARDPDPDGTLAASLGLEPRELARTFDGLEGELADVCDAWAPLRGVQRGAGGGAGCASGGADSRGGRALALVRVHWSELYAGLARELVPLFAAGASAVVLSDPTVPELAELFAGALATAGLPAAALAVLHADHDELVRAAVDGDTFDSVRLVGLEPLGARVERWRAAGGGAHFGAGVVARERATRVEFRAPGSSTARVRRDDDPRARAHEVLRAALGRAASLSGQRAGQIGRVVCHPRAFSAFTGELLRILRSEREYREPLPFLDPDLAGHVRRARELGLDEGATLIHEGPDEVACASGSAAGWIVFTNVEPHMRIASLTRPAPLLSLMREGG